VAGWAGLGLTPPCVRLALIASDEEWALYFQKVLKGVGGIDDDEARYIMREAGITSNWWRNVGKVTPAEVQAKLTVRNLRWHLDRYEDVDSATGAPFFENTPFISTTAGTVERDVRARGNVSFPPLFTAIRFATDDFTRGGYVFLAYVYTLAKQALPLVDFAEEVRDVHVYTGFLPFHFEGEVLVKMHIPSVRIERVDKYGADGKVVRRESNPAYEPPERYANVRGLL
jgi:hypothetical protein